MEIKQVTGDKKQYLELLLLADPSEDMINKYLEQGEMFAMTENGVVICIAVVLPLSDSVCELKNIAVESRFQRSWKGSEMIRFLLAHYGGWFDKMIVGTARDGGRFYEKNGFVYSHTVKNFFKDNYDEPVLDENGEEYTDMFYYKKDL